MSLKLNATEQILTQKRYRTTGGWLINGVIPEQKIGLIYGPVSGYKSFLALDIALSVATGIDWHGIDSSHGAVVYITTDKTRNTVKRIKAWSEHKKVDLQNSASKFIFLDYLDFSITESFENLMRFIYVMKEDIKLIVFDVGFKLLRCSSLPLFFKNISLFNNHFKSTCLMVGPDCKEFLTDDVVRRIDFGLKINQNGTRKFQLSSFSSAINELGLMPVSLSLSKHIWRSGESLVISRDTQSKEFKHIF